MIDHLLKRGTLVAVVLTMVMLLGIVAATRVPVQMIPDLETRIISIDTRWPGATPQPSCRPWPWQPPALSAA